MSSLDDHPRGWRHDHGPARSFRGGCTCWPCALRRAPAALADALFGVSLGLSIWRHRGRRP